MLVKQAANVIEILEYFVKRKHPATLTEISNDLAWPRSSTFNLVNTLVDKGYIYEPRIRGGYYPSPRWLTMAQTLSNAEPLPEGLYTLVSEIVNKTGETTAICASAGASAVLIHVEESQQSIRYFTQIGSRLPVYASSAGRAILAQYSQKERMSIYRKVDFRQYISGPMSVETVEIELRMAQKRGYHQSDSEYIADLAGVAIALPFAHRRLSIVVAGPTSRCLGRRSLIAKILQDGINALSTNSKFDQ